MQRAKLLIHQRARACGDSTVAYSIAFSRAVEAALGVAAPPRAHWLRAVLAELERREGTSGLEEFAARKMQSREAEGS